MEETVSFAKQYDYDTLKIGITVPVRLVSGNEAVVFEAKLDTGAENCIFERIHGERLGLIIESGEKQVFSTAAGNFVAYAHEVGLSVLEIEFFTRVYFAESPNFTRSVLGRIGWLDRVKLGLIDYEGKLLLSAYGE
jgi:hypothetical protein